jgi:putative membrane protein
MVMAQTSNPSNPTNPNPSDNPNASMNAKSTTTGGVLTADHKFMAKAAQGGMAEVELGQLAEQNAQSSEVKSFGKRMVDDHSKANDQLKQLASQKGVALPTTLDAKDQAQKDRLSKLHGEAFDKAYMHDMVMDHKKDVAEFKHEATSAHDPDLKNFAQQTVPTLESHLQEAEKIAGTTGNTAMGKHNGNEKGMSNTTAQEH